jgi:hypothetical protein
MRVFANYDVSGKIRSLTWFNAPKGVSLALSPQPGELVAEVDGHGLTGVPTDRQLRDLAQTHAVAQPVTRCTLVKKA